jgi:hypothetical protein
MYQRGTRMQKRLIAAMVALMFIASGCNLGSAQGVEEDIATQPVVSGRPVVTITSPATGDEFAVDEQVFVRIEASDAAGVTRAQLFADGEIVRTISSESISGNTEFEGVLDYTPRNTGDYTLRVLAFRGAIASDPAEITITVVEDADDVQVTSRPDTGSTTGFGTGTTGGTSGQPVIPNDGVCRSLTSVGLNLRSEPTTARENVISVLPGGTLAPIVARLGDNSWWKISYANRLGWVSAQFTTIYGNCSSVPVESFSVNTPIPLPTATIFLPTITPLPTLTRTPTQIPTPGRPDLIVASIVGAQNVTIPSGEDDVTEQYAITISNLGFGPSPQFDVVMRVNDVEIDMGVVSNLNNGQTIVLTQDVTFSDDGNYTIRVEADPGNLVTEVSEVNNRGDISVNVNEG